MRQRPLVWLAAAVAAGITLAGWVRPHPLLPLGLLCGALAAMVAWRRRSWPWLILALLAAGAWRYSHLRHGGPGELGVWLDRPAELMGTALDVRQDQRNWRAVLTVAAVRPPDGDWVAVSGRVWTTWYPSSGGQVPDSLPREGDWIRVVGVLVEPAGPRPRDTFDFREYLARRGVFLVLDAPEPPLGFGSGREPGLRKWARRTRQYLEAAPRTFLAPDQAALLAGLVLGTKEGIPVEWQTAFRVTGVYHILAASGANVALVIMPLLWVLARLGLTRRGRSLAALPVVAMYCLVAGAGPPVTRAAIMAAVALVGEALDRPADAFNSLAAAGIAILLAAPGQLYDLGFQLSFAATLGILILSRPVQTALERVLVRPVAIGLAVTVAAGVAVEPLLWATFGYVTVASPLANLVVAPVLVLLVPLGLGAMLLGAVWSAAAAPVLGICSLLLRWLVQPVEWLSLVPGAYLPLGAIPVVWALPWYAALACWRWWPLWCGHLIRLSRWARRIIGIPRVVAAGLALLMLTVAVFRVPRAEYDDALPDAQLALLAVAGGETEVQLPDGLRLPVQAARQPPPGIVGMRAGVWRAEHGDTVFLLMGALDSREQRALLGNPQPLRATVFLAPPAPVPELLAAVRPQVVVFAAAPRPEVTAGLRQAGITVLRTDRHGQVTVSSDGHVLYTRVTRRPWPEAVGRWFGAW